MPFSFNPSLGSVLNIRPSPGSDTCRLNFYAYEDQETSSKVPGSRIPEIWTDAKLSDENDEPTPIWKAIVFRKIQSASLTPKKSNTLIWQAELCLKSQSGKYGFTYRLSAAEDKIEKKVEWLGSTGDNGQIRVHASIENSVEDRLLVGLKTNATDDVIIQYPFDITTHLFTYPSPQKPDHTNPPIDYQQPLIDLDDEAFGSIEGLLYERTKPTWYNPRSITSFNQISQNFDTQAIIFKRPVYDNLAVVLWPISSPSRSSTFRRNSNSQLVLCSNSGDQPQVAISIGPEWALQQLISAAVGNSETSESCSKNLVPQKLRYCTWNALGPEYRLSNVLKGLEDLEESKLANLIDGILLDDGWQDTTGRTLSGWGAKKDWFDKEKILSQSKHTKHHLENHVNHIKNVKPEGTDLKVAVDRIRRTGRGNIKYVGVWITLNGYWEGLDPHSDKMKHFKLQRWSVRNPENLSDHQTTTWYLPSISSISDFWDAYFGYLKKAGVDFVKVDNQAGLDYVYQCESQPSESAQTLRSKMWTSMNSSALRIFGVDPIYPLIHCMAHSPQIWGCRPSRLMEPGKLSTPTAKWVMRTSDDFFPDERNPDAHRWHLISNAFNSLLACGIGFTPDFDMTMTRHPFSAYHTALRVFSPSPIYITDRIGEHDLVTSRKITSALKSGGFGVVQSNGIAGTVLAGRSLGLSMDRLIDDTTAWGLLKIGLPVGNVGGALIGIWNVKNNSGVDLGLDLITKRDISEALGIDSLKKESNQMKDIAIYSRNQRTFTVLHDFKCTEDIKEPNHSSSPVMTVPLRDNTFDILTVSQVWKIPEVSGVGIATFGVMDAFCGLSGIRQVQETESVQKKVQSKPKSKVETKPPIAIKEQNSQPSKSIKNITSTTNSFTPYGRLRFIYNYLIQDPKSKNDAHSMLKSLLQDFFKSPIRTVFSEGFAIFKMSIGLSLLLATTVLFRFLPTQSKRNETLSTSNPKVKDDMNSSEDSKVNGDEQSQLLQSPTDHDDEKRNKYETFNDQDSNEMKLRFKTPYTSTIGFGLIINRRKIKLNQKKHDDNEIFKVVRDLIKFRVNEEIVESSLGFEKVDRGVEGVEERDELVYLVYLDLEQFAQTHLVEVGESDWIIEIEGVKSNS